jgi:hypothetical protein
MCELQAGTVRASVPVETGSLQNGFRGGLQVCHACCLRRAMRAACSRIHRADAELRTGMHAERAGNAVHMHAGLCWETF